MWATSFSILCCSLMTPNLDASSLEGQAKWRWRRGTLLYTLPAAIRDPDHGAACDGYSLLATARDVLAQCENQLKSFAMMQEQGLAGLHTLYRSPAPWRGRRMLDRAGRTADSQPAHNPTPPKGKHLNLSDGRICAALPQMAISAAA